MLGMANVGASVTVNSAATDYRRGEYFQKAVTVANNNNPVWQPNSVSTTGGGVFVPQTPESFGYDVDGNLSSDGHWNYSWDAENRLIQMTTKTGMAEGMSQEKLAGKASIHPHTSV